MCYLHGSTFTTGIMACDVYLKMDVQQQQQQQQQQQNGVKHTEINNNTLVLIFMFQLY
jgi:hypothetical protein